MSLILHYGMTQKPIMFWYGSQKNNQLHLLARIVTNFHVTYWYFDKPINALYRSYIKWNIICRILLQSSLLINNQLRIDYRKERLFLYILARNYLIMLIVPLKCFTIHPLLLHFALKHQSIHFFAIRKKEKAWKAMNCVSMETK